MWGLASPTARATNESFLSQIFQAELSVRLESAGTVSSLAASADAGATFSILLEVSIRRLAQESGKVVVPKVSHDVVHTSSLKLPLFFPESCWQHL